MTIPTLILISGFIAAFVVYILIPAFQWWRIGFLVWKYSRGPMEEEHTRSTVARLLKSTNPESVRYLADWIVREADKNEAGAAFDFFKVACYLAGEMEATLTRRSRIRGRFQKWHYLGRKA